jgi:drug/metabolite transporter (DMT)-like permease
LAIPGAMAKETFVPFSIVFAAAWLAAARRTERRKPAQYGWILAMGAAGVATIIGVQSAAAGHVVSPLRLTVPGAALESYWANLLGCFRRHEF